MRMNSVTAERLAPCMEVVPAVRCDMQRSATGWRKVISFHHSGPAQGAAPEK